MLKKCKIEKKANPKVEKIYTNPYTVYLYIRGNSKKFEKKTLCKNENENESKSQTKNRNESLKKEKIKSRNNYSRKHKNWK